MIKQIIFLVYWPVTTTEAEWFKFDYLKQSGFDVRVFVCSELMNGKTSGRSVATPPIGCATRTISSYEELDRLVKEFGSYSIFIDYLRGLSHWNIPQVRIFRTLQRHKAKYYAVYGAARPLRDTPSLRAPGKIVAAVREKLVKIFNLPLLFDFLGSRVLYLLVKYAKIAPHPEKIFSGDSETLRNYLHKYRLSPDRVVPTHSHDYDHYLEYKRKNLHIDTEEGKTCVFLDEGATHHPDFVWMRSKPLDPDRYYPVMNRLFDRIEEKTGLKVVIAAHPRSHYENPVFGKREIIKGKTAELVGKCALVVAHCSTSINVAVAFDRPLLMIKTPEMVSHLSFSSYIDITAKSLGLKAVSLDGPESLDKISFDYQHWPKTYDDYRYKYLQSDKVGDKVTMEIVANEIKRFNSQ